MDSQEKACLVARCAAGLKAERVVVLEVGQLAGWCDYFVICSSWTRAQARAIADAVQQQQRLVQSRRLRREGYAGSGWILTDWGDVVLHVFVNEVREYYGLERLWGDAPRVAWAMSGEQDDETSHE